jgi:BirA family biotin operon repressor/biotin-[acetyl-CoA-carboxylase] ligase
MNPVSFPPLLSGHAVSGPEDPFETACKKAILGCDAGLVTYNLAPDSLRAALVFAPEVPLRQAMAMLPTCGVGFQNALGALAPPEVAVHLEWQGHIRVNGARCGGLRCGASSTDPDTIPDWLVIGLHVPLWPTSQDSGDTPDETALYAEGCADVEAPALLESWARHSLHWITRWEDGDSKALHAEWRGIAHGTGEDTVQADLSGTFLGVDENFGMLLRAKDTTHLIPLTSLLETP